MCTSCRRALVQLGSRVHVVRSGYGPSSIRREDLDGVTVHRLLVPESPWGFASLALCGWPKPTSGVLGMKCTRISFPSNTAREGTSLISVSTISAASGRVSDQTHRGFSDLPIIEFDHAKTVESGVHLARRSSPSVSSFPPLYRVAGKRKRETSSFLGVPGRRPGSLLPGYECPTADLRLGQGSPKATSEASLSLTQAEGRGIRHGTDAFLWLLEESRHQ